MRKDIGEEYLGPLSTKEGFAMHISLTRPFTRGSLRLRSSDPQVRGGEGDPRGKRRRTDQQRCRHENLSAYSAYSATGKYVD